MNFIFLIVSFILYVFSFLVIEHLEPWTNFYNNYYVLISSILVAFSFKLNDRIKVNLIGVLIFSVFIIGIFQCFYYFKYFQDFLIQSFYLLFLFFSIVFFNNLNVRDKKTLILFFIYSIIIAGVLSSIIAFYQFLRDWRGELWMLPLYGVRLYANLGQPNQLATLLLLSIFSISFLNIKKVNSSVFLIPFLTFVLYMTQSRTVILFIFFLVFILILKRKSITISYFFSVFVFLLSYLFSYFFSISFLNNNVSIIKRMNSGFARIQMWKDYFLVLKNDFSFIGVGYGEVEKSNFMYGEFSHEYFSSYHNILLDFIYFFGILGGLTILIIFYLIIKLLIKNIDVEGISILIFLIIFINHAFLEFPLYYLYFLFPFSFFLSYFFDFFDFKYLYIDKFIYIFIYLLFCFLSIIIFNNYSEGKIDYRDTFLGKCVLDVNYYFFDRFKDVNYIVCYNNEFGDLGKIEKNVINNPSKNYILKLIYIFDYQGDYKKRDYYLNKFNKKYKDSVIVEDVRKLKFN